MTANRWTMRAAGAHFPEVARRARAGDPQLITVRGGKAVAVVDPERFDIFPKPARGRTLAGFIEESKKYRGVTEGIDFERPMGMTFRDKHREIFDDDLRDKDEL
jgi:prevent-host-death family protein